MTRGRPRCFDEAEALDSAMRVFWEKGYAGASCDDLLAAMNMKAGSMYCAFGDKEKLYAKALEHYTRKRFGKLLEVLASDQPPLDRIRKLFQGIGQHMCQPDSHGCFVINTLVEASEATPQSEMARQSLLQLQNALEKTLKEARKRGELSNPVPPADLAALFVSTLQGINLMNRTQMGEKSIKGAVKSALSLLH